MRIALRCAALALLTGTAPALAGPTGQPPLKNVEFPFSCSPAAKALMSKVWDDPALAWDEQRTLFSEAVSSDPKCALAKAWLAWRLPASEGQAMFAQAKALMPSVTEVEKLNLQAIEAARGGDTAKGLDLVLKARDLLPNCALQQIIVCDFAGGPDHKLLRLEAATRATQLDPASKPGWKQLGLADLALHKYAEAAAAFKKLTELAPADPKAYDELGDALLSNNQLGDAAAAYQKAIDVSSGAFTGSWTGIASVKAFKGDWDGARAALAKARDGAASAKDKLWFDLWTALSWSAQGNWAQGQKAMDAYEKAVMDAKLDQAFASSFPMNRCSVAIYQGQYAQVVDQCTRAEKVMLPGASPADQLSYRANSLVNVLTGQARLGQIADAEKTLAAVEQLYAKAPGAGRDQLAMSQGIIALAKSKPTEAVKALSSCGDDDTYARLYLAEAQEKAGDKASAKKTRALVATANRRDPWYWLMRARAEQDSKPHARRVAVP